MGDPNWWAHFGQKSQFFPNFIVKIGQEKTPQKCGGFSCFQVFSSFFFLPFFAFVFLLSLCISTSWSLKRYPPGGVSGIYIYTLFLIWRALSYIYIYIYVYPICCLRFGAVSKEKQRFGPFLGKWRRLEGNKKTKLHQILVHLFTIKLGFKWDV